MKKLFIIPLLGILVLTGCSISFKTRGGVDGGVYKTADYGDNWEQITLVYRVGDLKKTFSTVDLTSMTMDPTDTQAIYIGTQEQGMYYTYDGGIGWHQALTGLGRINDIKVSPQERCVIYAAIGNRVYKSTDCNRHWTYQLIETRKDPKNQITSLAVDSYNTNIIYAGTSGYGLFKSEDGGFSWHAVKFFDSRVTKVLVNNTDTRIIYVATNSKGIFKTTDAGASWNQIISDEIKKEKKNVMTYRNIILDPTVDDGLLYASQYGLLRSRDGGASWQDIKLLTPPSTSTIYSLAINPQDDKEIYYGISSTLYRSLDNGENWITRSLPSSRAAKYIFLDPINPNILYLGVKQIK